MVSQIAPDSYHIFRPGSWILAEGEDAHEFLQSQFSNDISSLDVGQTKYGLWLDQKGKVHGDSQILRVGDESFYLFSYFTDAGELIEKLESFIVADDVELEDRSSQVVGFSLFGKAVESFERIKSGDDLELESFHIQGRRGRSGVIDVILSKEQKDSFLNALRSTGIADSVDEAAIELLRMISLVPHVPGDIGPTELPQEGGLEKDGVSFIKGCYLGQEVMSRLHSMGQVRRSLALIESSDPIPSGSILTVDGKKVGTTKTSLKYQDHFIALALISNTVSEVQDFQVGDGEGGHIAKRADLSDGQN
jgi:hypothetical protein